MAGEALTRMMNFLDGAPGFAVVILGLVSYLFLMLAAAVVIWGVVEFHRWRHEWEDDDE
jgi:hypothetical protein